ncbi:hypothetical protein GQR58_022511 [Nymphon striatum]|nr:hypothetical protein GQR58_022511 [Nymphon striatum]
MSSGAPSKSKSSKWTKMKEVFRMDKNPAEDYSSRNRLGVEGVQKSNTTDGVCRQGASPTSDRGIDESPQLLDIPFSYAHDPGSKSSCDTSRPVSALSDDSSIIEDSEMRIKKEIDELSVFPVLQAYDEDKSKSLPREQNLLEIPDDKYARQSSSSPASMNAESPSDQSHPAIKSDGKSGGKYIDKDGKKYKSAWYKVRDIIHTRKDSLKQKKNKKSTSTDQIDIDPSSGISVEISTVSDEDCLNVVPDYRKTSTQSEPGPRRTSSTEPHDMSKYGHCYFDQSDSGITSIHASPKERHKLLNFDLSSPKTKKKSMVLDLIPHHHGGLKEPDMCFDPLLGLQSILLERSNSYSGPKGKADSTGYSSSSSAQKVSKWNRVKKVLIKRRGRGGRKDRESGRTHRSLSVPMTSSDLHETSSHHSEQSDHEKDGDYFSIGAKCVESTMKLAASPVKVQEEEDLDEIMKRLSYSPNYLSEPGGRNRLSHVSTVTTPPSTLEELQRNLSEDFSKKMESWEKMKSTGRMQSPTGNRKQELWPSKYVEKHPSQKKDKSVKPKVDQTKLKSKDKEKALQWVEKELQKIDKEKQRLSKERQKFQERESRLEKLKGSMLQPQTKDNQDIFIKTAAGEFRFEGISKNFTKKLYEWEEKKGVVPELSTFALLTSGVAKEDPSIPEDIENPSLPSIPILFRPPPQMLLSRSEGSLAEVLQPSQNSSTFSLGPEKTEKFTHFSTSEPQLSPAEDTHHDYSAVGCYSPEEVTKLIDGDSADVSFSSRKSSRDVGRKETYTSEVLGCENSAEKTEDWAVGSGESPIDCGALWDENMSLLEKLKDKENECKKLERRLSELDSRLKEMTSQHCQEVDSYKDKLWETHETLFDKTKDIPITALNLAEDLKKKVEQLEGNVDRLKQERLELQLKRGGFTSILSIGALISIDLLTFKIHREEQNVLAEDLVEKMKELHKVNIIGNGEEESTKSSSGTKEITKINELTSQLVNQVNKLYLLLSMLLITDLDRS